MDTSIRIPLTGLHIGIDPIIGLVPGVGDLISTAFSAYIIFLATRFGIPRKDLAKMIFLDQARKLARVVGPTKDKAPQTEEEWQEFMAVWGN